MSASRAARSLVAVIACALSVSAAGVLRGAAGGRGLGGSKGARSVLAPEVVAKLLGQVGHSWIHERVRALQGQVNDSTALVVVEDSCMKVAQSVVKGSSGEADRVKEYMKIVCADSHGNEAFCRSFASEILGFMQGDAEFNRESLDYKAFCKTFYMGALTNVAEVQRQQDDKDEADRQHDAQVRMEAIRRAEEERKLALEAEAEKRRKEEEEAQARVDAAEREAAAKAEAEKEAESREEHTEEELREAKKATEGSAQQAKNATEASAQQAKNVTELSAQQAKNVTEASAQQAKNVTEASAQQAKNATEAPAKEAAADATLSAIPPPAAREEVNASAANASVAAAPNATVANSTAAASESGLNATAPQQK